MTPIPFAPEVQAEVDKIRANWTLDDHAHHGAIDGCWVSEPVSIEAIERYRRKRDEERFTHLYDFRGVCRPEWLRPFKLRLDNQCPQLRKRAAPSPTKPLTPPGQTQAELNAKLSAFLKATVSRICGTAV